MINQLTVLHLIPTFEVGGAERQLSMLACEQSRSGFNVHVAVRRGGEFTIPLDESGVIIHYLGDYPIYDLRIFFAVIRLVKSLRPDVLHTWLPQMDIVGGIVAKLFGTIWVATERADKNAYYGDIYNIIYIIRRCLIRFSNILIANSSAGRNYWSDILKDNQIFVVGNAVDYYGINQSISRANINKSCIRTILVVGRLIPSKAVDIIVEAIGIVSSIVPFIVKIYGDGPSKNHILHQIDRLNLHNRIVFMDSHDWWPEMRSASILISMSRSEGQPNVVLEAMAGGCPLILSDIPAHRNITHGDFNFFVIVDDFYMLANIIESVLINPNRILHDANKAKMRSQMMTIESVAASYSHLYHYALRREN